MTHARLRDLRRWNLGLAVLHAAQALAILVLASDFAITVTSQFPDGPPGSQATVPSALFDVPIGAAIAVFLCLAAADHLLTATWRSGRATSANWRPASTGSAGSSTP